MPDVHGPFGSSFMHSPTISAISGRHLRAAQKVAIIQLKFGVHPGNPGLKLWRLFMDTAVEDRTVKTVSAPGWQKVSRWIIAFLAQWLILTVAYALCLWISPLFSDFFYSPILALIQSPIVCLQLLGVGWLIVLILRNIVPGMIRKLVPGALDKYLLPVRKETEIESILYERAKLPPDNVAVAERLAVMLEIRERVRRLRLRTTGILATVGVALVGAAIIVVFAGSLTSIDATAVSNVDKVKSDIAEEQRQLTRLYQNQTQSAALEQARTAGIKSETERLERQLTLSSLPTEPTAIQAMISDGKERIVKLNALLEPAWKKELETQRGYSDWHYIAATAITRVGVVLIIIYLVQILIGLYRYNTRLATYYSAKQDVLGLWDGNPTSLKRLDEIMGSPKFDFGKEPRHPLEDLLKAAGSKMGAAVSRAKKVEEKVS
jgi:Tfp pilus assembly protein PilO